MTYYDGANASGQLIPSRELRRSLSRVYASLGRRAPRPAHWDDPLAVSFTARACDAAAGAPDDRDDDDDGDDPQAAHRRFCVMMRGRYPNYGAGGGDGGAGGAGGAGGGREQDTRQVRTADWRRATSDLDYFQREAAKCCGGGR